MDFLSFLLCATLLLLSRDASGLEIQSSHPNQVFTERERVVLNLLGRGEIELRLTNYRGETMREFREPLPVTLDLGPLPRGYYELVADAFRTALVVVADPTLSSSTESRVGVDAAHGWLLDSSRFAEGAELLRLTGVTWVRDRISWEEVEPERGRFEWGRYEENANALTGSGLRIVSVVHSTPLWARIDGESRRPADDLREVYRFYRAASERFRGRMDAWEPWNKADLSLFSSSTGDEIAAHVKVAALGIRDGNPDARVLMPSLSLAPGRFVELLFEAGIHSYCDLYNYHLYTHPEEYPVTGGAHARMAARFGVPRMPVWVTEAGMGLPQGERTEMDPDTQRIQAEFIPRSIVQSLASGAEQHFFFIFPSYLENGFQYGLFREDGIPYPGYAALSNAIQTLGMARYQGEVQLEIPLVKAFLFDRGDGERVLVAWCDTEPIDVQIPILGSVRVVDLVGRRTNVESSQGFTWEVGSPVFFVFSAQGFTGTLIPPASRPPAQIDPPSPVYSRIVPRLVFEDAIPEKKSESYRISTELSPLTLQVYNFGDTVFTGSVRFSIGVDWEIEPRTHDVRVEPMGRTDVVGFVKWKQGKPTSVFVRVDGKEGSATPVVCDLTFDVSSHGEESYRGLR